MRLDPHRIAQFTPLIVAMSWGLSLALHHPFAGWSIYSDVVSFWVREEHLREGRIPCIEYFFEYPPSACYLTYAARLLGGKDLIGYYLAFSLLSLPAFLAIGYVLQRMSREVNPLAFVFAFSPSLAVYGIYNFDHFLAALLGLSIIALTSGRWKLAGLLLGLSVSVKLMTVLLLPLYLLEGKGRRLGVFTWFVVGASIPTLPVLLLNPSWFLEFIRYLGGWGLENAWYIWIFQDPFSPTAKFFGVMLLVPLLMRSYTAALPVGTRSLLTVSSWLLTAYIFTPQMFLWLIPLMPFSVVTLYFWPIIDIANMYIILTWFTTNHPTLPWTLPQTMSLIRAIALAFTYYFALKASSKKSLLT
ncbi:MAG: DUF2029 domain-containing protein [Thaumarchaeota archaeon]|nr:DUF2029 domain-containing protein [Candidatus Calditenuaceae archaeon]MDW8186820.1 glycosyltransferase 87 family protein [Nitrososphaerota archaeon]